MNRYFIKKMVLFTILHGALAIGFCTRAVPAFANQNLNSKFPQNKIFSNTLGVAFIRIEPGAFLMGESIHPVPEELVNPLSYPTRTDLAIRYPHGDPAKFDIVTDHVRGGDFDEKPVHTVRISRPFYMGTCEITNAQYEQFDPAHRALRGKNGFSKGDDEAVVFVSWNDANAFCQWLSQKEDLPYRLPTEAEWEYACRAGTKTLFSTGDSLPGSFHKNAKSTEFNEPQDVVNLTAGKTPCNPWGLYDMHGNVEEWCMDWYGPYLRTEQTDPVGYPDGDFKVTRGGSHGSDLYYLRSANRMGTLPEDKHWLIGFRIVLGDFPASQPLPSPPLQRYQQNVRQEAPRDYGKTVNEDAPYFNGPRQYVKMDREAIGPLFAHHNHDPAIVACPNGDVLAIWYTCVAERGRELAVAVSRLRYGQEEWEPASSFWDAPDRNDHCPALWCDEQGTLYHFNGLGVAGKWVPLAIVMRTSKDNGVTWSRASLIVPEHGFRQMVGEPVFRMRNGAIVFGADASGGSTVWVSRDNGRTWNDPGGTINGIHAGIVELQDGRLMALGRNQNINGWMPMGISSDTGITWKTRASIFQPISGGQRAALIRLKEGPLFFASFADQTDPFTPVPDGQRPPRYKMSIFGAISFDDGRTWPLRRIIGDGAPDRVAQTIDGGPIRMSPNASEPQGYLSACQAGDGVIHLISSINHYAFNLAWLKQGQPAAPIGPAAKFLPVRDKLGMLYDGRQLPGQSIPAWYLLKTGAPESKTVQALPTGMLNVQADFPVRWSNERTGGFEELDAHRGFTLETVVQLPDRTDNGNSFEVEACARGGALTSNRYLLSVTASKVRYWYDQHFIEVAGSLDNHGAKHRYRLAVRCDAAVQIYRDGKLLGVQPQDLIIDWSQAARGSYVEWGVTGSNPEARIGPITLDPNGPFQPE